MTAGDGKPCKKCGTQEWDAKGNCKQCARDRATEWKNANPGKSANSKREWSKKNRDKKNALERDRYKRNPEVKEKVREWREANPERCKEYSRKWRRENLTQHNETNRKWRENNPDKAKEAVKRWNKNNPDKATAIVHRRLAKKKSNGGQFTAEEWNKLCDQYGNRCVCCGRCDVRLTVDHVIPLKMGGTSNIDNIQPLCQECNSRKNAKHIDYRTKPGILRWIQKKLFD